MPWKHSSESSQGIWRLFSLDPWICYFYAWMVLILPLNWFFAAVTAALVHEMWHAVFIYLLGGHIHRIHISLGSIVMYAQMNTTARELICAAAGPAGSFLLLSLYRYIPEISLCAGIQGLFNLLPVYPMDGGRILKCLLVSYPPDQAERIMDWVECAAVLVVLLLATAGVCFLSLGWLSLIAGVFWLSPIIIRKIPCKQR